MLPSGATAGPSVSPPSMGAERVKSNSSRASEATIASPLGAGRDSAACAAAASVRLTKHPNSICFIAGSFLVVGFIIGLLVRLVVVLAVGSDSAGQLCSLLLDLCGRIAESLTATCQLSLRAIHSGVLFLQFPEGAAQRTVALNGGFR